MTDLHATAAALILAADDPRHGTPQGYNAGCKCGSCRVARNTHERNRRKRRQVLGIHERHDAAPTQRRIRALMALGWRSEDIAERAGWATPQAVTEILKDRRYVFRPTAETIARVYGDLHMTRGPSAITAKRAKAAGYPPPLAWEDIDAGVKAAWQRKVRGHDHAIVERILSGDWSLAHSATTTERDAVVRRWKSSGRAIADLEELTGWCVDRYFARRDGTRDTGAA